MAWLNFLKVESIEEMMAKKPWGPLWNTAPFDTLRYSGCGVP
jgi:hypothetical protein